MSVLNNGADPNTDLCYTQGATSNALMQVVCGLTFVAMDVSKTYEYEKFRSKAAHLLVQNGANISCKSVGAQKIQIYNWRREWQGTRGTQ